ncbi:Sel1-like protein [Pasteurella multocida]|nr:Sel1-like protein [Pasteurella multocida]
MKRLYSFSLFFLTLGASLAPFVALAMDTIEKDQFIAQFELPYKQSRQNNVNEGKVIALFEEVSALDCSDPTTHLNELAYGSRSTPPETKQISQEEREKLAHKYFKTALELIQREVDNGDTSYLYTLGYMYENAYGTEKNLEKATALYERAVKLGNPSAMRNLAYLHQEGDLPNDDNQAFKLFLQAAEQNDAKSQYEVGLYYVDRGHFDKGFTWLKKAADQGLQPARHTIATLSLMGWGTKKNVDFALKEFEAIGDYAAIAGLYESEEVFGYSDLSKALYYYQLAYTNEEDPVEKKFLLEKLDDLKIKLKLDKK